MDDVLTEISRKLDVLIALSLRKEDSKATTSDRVEFLLRFGLSNQEIAGILGTSKNTIEVMKSRLKKGSK